MKQLQSKLRRKIRNAIDMFFLALLVLLIIGAGRALGQTTVNGAGSNVAGVGAETSNDSTLGGGSPSASTVPTQAATQSYVAAHGSALPAGCTSASTGVITCSGTGSFGTVAAGAACPASYPAGTVCANVVNGMVNAVGYGADPTGATSSDAGILAAAAAATASMPGAEANTIYFPCGDYVVNEVNLSPYPNLMLKGEDNDICVRFFYGGVGGVGSYLFNMGALTSGGLQYLRFEGNNLGSSITTMAQNALVITTVDSMATLEHLSFVDFFGDAIVMKSEPTNLYMRHFRADALGGYLIAFSGNNTANGDPVHLYDFTIDNTLTSAEGTFKAANPYTTGAVATVAIATAGSGMTNGTYRVPAGSNTPSGAACTPVITGTAMTGCTMTNNGANYDQFTSASIGGCTTAPIVEPVINTSAGTVTSLTILTPGLCSGTTTAAFHDAALPQAYAQIVITGGALTSVNLLGEGSQYTSAPTFNLANATTMSGGTIGGGLGGTLGTLTATLGTISSTQNGKGVVFCAGCNGMQLYVEHVRYEHNSPDVTIGNADEGTFYFNDDSSASGIIFGLKDFIEVGNTSSPHPVISSAQQVVRTTLLGPNNFTQIAGVYKNRSTQQAYGSNFEGGSSYWSFGKSGVQFQGNALEGQLWDVTPSADIVLNPQPRQYGDWFYRRSDFVPGTNGPIRMVTSPASGRALTATGGAITICTTAVIAANASTGTANVTGCNPLSHQLQLNDNIQLTNSGVGGTGTTTAQITCIDGTGAGTACAGLGAQGIVISVAPGCLPSSCPGTTTLQWQNAVLGDFGLEATRSATIPTTNPCNNGQYVWNSTAPSNTQPIGWRCQSNAWITLPNYGAATIEVAGTAVTPTAGAVNLVAGSNVTLTPSGNQVTISAAGPGANARVAYGYCIGYMTSSATGQVYGLGDTSTGCTNGSMNNFATVTTPANGTLSNLTVACSSHGAAANSAAGDNFTIYVTPKNGGSSTSTGITVFYGSTIANYAVVQDTTDTYNYNAGDRIAVQFATVASDSIGNCNVSFNY